MQNINTIALVVYEKPISMKINTKTRYGLRTLIELALNKDKGTVYQKDISKRQGISFKYMDQIISGLKSAGLITTVGGKKSGYMLAKKSGNITIYDVYRAFNPKMEVVDCLNDEINCKKESNCASKNYWSKLNDAVIESMRSTTIEDLMKEQEKMNMKQQEFMFHI